MRPSFCGFAAALEDKSWGARITAADGGTSWFGKAQSMK
jgi:hypothetical protein